MQHCLAELKAGTIFYPAARATDTDFLVSLYKKSWIIEQVKLMIWGVSGQESRGEVAYSRIRRVKDSETHEVLPKSVDPKVDRWVSRWKLIFLLE